MSFTCEICKKDFKNQHGLSIHLSKMHSRLTCGICQRSDFKNEQGLSIHISRIHPQECTSYGRKETELYTRQHRTGSKDGRGEKSFSMQRETPRSKDRLPTTHNPHGSTVKVDCKSYSGAKREHKGHTRTLQKALPSKLKEIPKIDSFISEKKDVAKDVQTSPQSLTKSEGKAGGRSFKQRKEKELLDIERSPSSMSDSSLLCRASDKSKLLIMLQAGIKCPKEDSQLRRDRVKIFVRSLEETIAGISDVPLELFKSGSFYDNTKIDYADEFDFMFYPKANFEADFTNCPPGFCKIKKGRTTSQDFDKMFNKDGYLVPESFKEKMFQIFKNCIASPDFHEGRRTRRKLRPPESPAFTVLYDLQLYGKPPIDIDLVPAIKIDGWSPNFTKLHANWLSDDHARKAMKCFHAVTKTFPGKHADAELLWRVSFSHAEKKLINHADYTDKGVRKTIFKILKKIKEDIKTDCPGIEKFCSYHLKMFMLGFFDRHKDFSETNKELLLNQSIRELVKGLQGGEIINYFIQNDNILTYIPEKERALVAQKFSEKI